MDENEQTVLEGNKRGLFLKGAMRTQGENAYLYVGETGVTTNVGGTDYKYRFQGMLIAPNDIDIEALDDLTYEQLMEAIDSMPGLKWIELGDGSESMGQLHLTSTSELSIGSNGTVFIDGSDVSIYPSVKMWDGLNVSGDLEMFSGDVLLSNTKMIRGQTTGGTNELLVQKSAGGNCILGTETQTNNTNIYTRSGGRINFSVGGTHIGSIREGGLYNSNGTLVLAL